VWNTIAAVVVGGLISSLSGIAAVYFQAVSTKRKRMDEIMAERKVTADAEAYSRVKRLQGLLYENLDEAWAHMCRSEEWFFNNRIFLPGNFPNKWITTRNWLSELVIWRRDNLKTPSEQVELLKKIEGITAEAIDEVYKDVGGKRIETEDHCPEN